MSAADTRPFHGALICASVFPRGVDVHYLVSQLGDLLVAIAHGALSSENGGALEDGVGTRVALGSARAHRCLSVRQSPELSRFDSFEERVNRSQVLVDLHTLRAPPLSFRAVSSSRA
jgi:hypothetical protein